MLARRQSNWIQSTFHAKSNRASRFAKKRKKLSFECMESRQMFSGLPALSFAAAPAYQSYDDAKVTDQVTFNAANGLLSIIGSTSQDTMSVATKGNQLEVTISHDGVTRKQSFSAAPVMAIAFFGRDGNDSFINKTSTSSIAFGGAGNDTITGGIGSDLLLGGDGTDVLIGNAGNDFLNGGLGVDVLDGRQGDDAYVVDLQTSPALDRIEEQTQVGTPFTLQLQTPDGKPLAPTKVQAKYGAVRLGSNSTIIHTPRSDFVGDYEITYQVATANGTPVSGRIVVSAKAAVPGSGNSAFQLTPLPEQFVTGGSQPTLVQLKASGVDATKLTYSARPLNGIAAKTQLTGNQLSITPPVGFYGPLQVQVTASDGKSTATTTFTLNVLGGASLTGDTLYIYGEQGKDSTYVTSNGDLIDVYFSAAGNLSTSLYSSSGWKQSSHSAANVHHLVYRGYGGDDWFEMVNFAIAPAISVTAHGDDGDDSLFGSGQLFGDAGNDGIWGNGRLDGGDGDDMLDGHSQSELLGGAGNDRLYGRGGRNILNGGAGSNTYESHNEYGERAPGIDTVIDGGQGEIAYDSTSREVRVYGTYASNDVGTATFVNNELQITLRVDQRSMTQRYPLASVDRIRFEGHDGNDRFVNGTSIPCTLIGGEGNDDLRGGDGNDQIEGGNGSNRLVGNGGNDLLTAGLPFTTTNDYHWIEAGAGDDTVRYYAGTGICLGGSGNDDISGAGELHGGEGSDYVSGGGKLYGNDGNDTLSGSSIADSLYGGAGELHGGEGNDYISGGGKLYGNDGNDTLSGSSIADSLYGGAGDDELVGWNGNDLLFGDAGHDRLFGEIGNDTLYGGIGNDVLSGHEGDDLIYGEAGSDSIWGWHGKDVLNGGDDGDSIVGGDNDDTIYGGNGSDTLFGERGSDALWGDSGDDMILGGEGADVLLGGDDRDTVYGGSESDTINGGSGSDWLYGEDGYDALNGGDDNDQMWGGVGNDILDGDSGDDRLRGDTGSDTLRGGSGSDTMWGGDHDDAMFGGDDGDELQGGGGSDTLFGEHGADRLWGDDGNDSLYGDSNGHDFNDYLNGGFGNDGLYGGGVNSIDTLQGGDGADRCLTQNGDVLVNLAMEDAKIVFRAGNQSWTNEEIVTADSAFRVIHRQTGSTRLLKDAFWNETIVFERWTTLTHDGKPAGGVNFSREHDRRWNPWLFRYETTNEYKTGPRLIQIAVVSARVILHEIGHNWDEGDEMEYAGYGRNWAVDYGVGSDSDWKDKGWSYNYRTESWSYSTSAKFVSAYASTSPFEDFAETFAAYFCDVGGLTFSGASPFDNNRNGSTADDSLGAAGSASKIGLIRAFVEYV